MDDCVYLGIGSNLGDREQNIRRAGTLLGHEIIRKSSLYESEPVEYRDQPWFLNSVWQIRTGLSPNDLLKRCQGVELQLGRKREIPKGPRSIDLDLLFYGDVVLQEPDLVLPHPSIAERRFVLLPMVEIAPDFLHPVLGKNMKELLDTCRDLSVVRAYGAAVD